MVLSVKQLSFLSFWCCFVNDQRQSKAKFKWGPSFCCLHYPINKNPKRKASIIRSTRLPKPCPLHILSLFCRCCSFSLPRRFFAFSRSPDSRLICLPPSPPDPSMTSPSRLVAHGVYVFYRHRVLRFLVFLVC